MTAADTSAIIAAADVPYRQLFIKYSEKYEMQNFT